MYISLIPKELKEKPIGNNINTLSMQIAKNAVEINDIRRLAEDISTKGYTWAPAIFNGRRRLEDLKEIQLFALDFDGGVTFKDIKKQADQLFLNILFSYETFSSINENRFRVVFKNDIPITDRRTAQLMYAMLIEIFDGCDKNCKDPSRMYFGGKNLIYFNEKQEEINIDILSMALSASYKNKYSKANYGRNLKRFANKNNICYSNQMLKIRKTELVSQDEEKSPSTIICEKVNGENSSIYYIINYIDDNGKRIIKDKKNKCNHKAFRPYILKDMYKKCRLYKEFVSDTKWLYHNELFGIASVMVNVETGKKFFFDTVKNSKFESYRKKDWKFYLDYINKQNYKPECCSSFCPYCDKCCHEKNILLTLRLKKNKIIDLKKNIDYVSIEEAYNEVKSNFITAMESDDEKIHIIKAQTAIGKTYIYTNYLKDAKNPCIIALPTNKLKNEVYKRCLDLGVQALKTISIYELENKIPDNIYENILSMYSKNKGNHVIKYLQKCYDDSSNEAIGEFLKNKELLKNFKGHIITTHHKVLYSSEKWLSGYNIIVDEDILKTMITNQSTVEISNLEEFFIKNELKGESYKKMQEIIYKNDQKHLLTTKIIIDNNHYDCDFDINGILKSRYFYTDGKTLIYLPTPYFKKLKYVIMSATADEDVYKFFAGKENVICYNCKEARNKGQLKQYVKDSYSRDYITRNEETYNKVRKLCGDIPIITFKKFSENCEIHFGNSEGSDEYKGQNLAIVGTPHLAPFIYELAGLHVGVSEFKQQYYQEIEYKGYRFWFMTYENKILRTIQLWLIESELIQSVGRARLLRFNCTVTLFSNFPLRQAEFMDFDD